MATSGSYDFTRTRDEIINAALRKLGVLAEGETATAEQTNEAAEALNAMVKSWMGKGIHLWVQQEIILFLEASTTKQSYTIGPSGDHATTSLVKTELSADEAAAQTTISVDSSTGISASDNVGIVLDDGTLHWTTISSVPDSTSIVIASGLPSVASTDNHVYTYTSKPQRPLRVQDARLKINDGNEVPMTGISRDSYFDLPNKGAAGKPTQFYYNPTLTNGTFYIWTTSDDVADYITMTTDYPLQDFDSANDNPDFPVEWIRTLIWNLADELKAEYGESVGQMIRDEIEAKAIASLDDLLDWDQEYASIWTIPTNEAEEGWE